MSTKNNLLFESLPPAIAPLALRHRDAAAALGSTRCWFSEWRESQGRHYAPPASITSTFLSKRFITETCQ